MSSSPSGPGQSRAASSSACRNDWPAPSESASTEIASGRSRKIASASDVRSEHEIGSEEPGDGEEKQYSSRGQPSGRRRIGKKRDQRDGEGDERLMAEEARQRLPATRLAQIALIRRTQA